MAASLALFAVFILRERRTPHPLVDLSLFGTGRFSRGIGTGLLCYLVLFGVLFVTPLYLEVTHGLPSAQAVLMLTVLLSLPAWLAAALSWTLALMTCCCIAAVLLAGQATLLNSPAPVIAVLAIGALASVVGVTSSSRGILPALRD